MRQRSATALTSHLLIAGLISLSPGCSPAPTNPRRSPVSGNVVGVQAGSSYCYIVRTRDGAVLVDAGSDPAGRQIREALKEMGLADTSVRAILLTHGHRENFAAAASFHEAVVYVSEMDHILLRGDRDPESLDTKITARLKARPQTPRNIRNTYPGTRLIIDDETFAVIGVPGHTYGSLAFVHEGVIFSGDALWVQDGQPALPPWYSQSNPAMGLRALQRLRQHEITTIADGHGGILRDARGPLHTWLDAQGAP